MSNPNILGSKRELKDRKGILVKKIKNVFMSMCKKQFVSLHLVILVGKNTSCGYFKHLLNTLNTDFVL